MIVKYFSSKISEIVIFFTSTYTLIIGILGFWVLKKIYWGDPTIYLIYARNIARGDWFDFNPSQFSSGATSPLWALILAVGFHAGNGIFIAKVISGIFTFVALVSTLLIVKKVTQSSMLGVLGMALVACFLLLPGLMMYETSLIVLLVNLAMYYTYQKNFILLTIVWALIPVTRPECIILVLFNIIWIIASNHYSVFRVIRNFLIAMIPTILYFSYSYIMTGLFSTSSVARGFALRESFSLYYLEEYMRYFLPIISVVFVIAGRILKRALQKMGGISAVGIALLTILLLFRTYHQILWNSSRNLTFDVITEREVISVINNLAESGDSILVYEVQDRFYLHDDISLLSLDGITDGKIVSYFQDVTSFLKYYQPDYWLANDAVFYRPFLSNSILRQVVLEAPTLGDMFYVEGIRFTNILDVPSSFDSNFASVMNVYKIEYDHD